MYQFHDTRYRGYYEFSSWWELIEHIISWRAEELIAHNENDTHVDYYETMWGWWKRKVYPRTCFVYKDWEPINLAEIRSEGIKKYVDKPVVRKKHEPKPWVRRGYFRYRLDPVPYTGKHRGCGWRHSHSYRKCYLDTLSYGLPDPRLQQQIEPQGNWDWDDEPYRFYQKSWKKQKKRKQWM